MHHLRNRMSSWVALPTAVAVAGVLFGISPLLASAATRTVNVVPGDDLYAPQNLGGINGGDTVTWRNNGTHIVKSARIPAGATAWTSPLQQGSSTFSQTVTAPGNYRYYCPIHSSAAEANKATQSAREMVGQFTVAAPIPVPTVPVPVPVPTVIPVPAPTVVPVPTVPVPVPTVPVPVPTVPVPVPTVVPVPVPTVPSSPVPPIVAPVTRLSDFNRDGSADMVARDRAGTLWLYPGNGAGGLLGRTSMGAGWNSFTAIVTPGDMNGDGNGDLLARNAAGQLWFYPGNGASRLGARHLAGASGWNSMTAITAAGNMIGDARPDMLARDSAGRLWLYPSTGTGTFGPRHLAGAGGWNTMTALTGAGDLSGDGRADLLARDKTGNLWLYPGNGTGGFGARSSAGAGWNAMTALVTPGNFDRTGGNDLIARDGAGTLWLYPGDNARRFGPRRQLGDGFSGYTIA